MIEEKAALLEELDSKAASVKSLGTALREAKRSVSELCSRMSQASGAERRADDQLKQTAEANSELVRKCAQLEAELKRKSAKCRQLHLAALRARKDADHAQEAIQQVQRSAEGRARQAMRDAQRAVWSKDREVEDARKVAGTSRSEVQTMVAEMEETRVSNE